MLRSPHSSAQRSLKSKRAAPEVLRLRADWSRELELVDKSGIEAEMDLVK